MAPLPAASVRLVTSSPLAESSTTRVWIEPAVSGTVPDQLSVPPLACTGQLPGRSAVYPVTLAKARSRASRRWPARTVTRCSLSDAWITRTSDLPWGVPSRSSSTWSRSSFSGPIPATV